MYFKDSVKATLKDLNAHGETNVILHNQRVHEGRLNEAECEFHSIIVEDHCPYIMPRGNGKCVYALYCQEHRKLQETYDTLVSIIDGRLNRDGPLIHGERYATVFEVVRCPPFYINTKEREEALKALIQMTRIPRVKHDVNYTGPLGEESLPMVNEFGLEGVEDSNVLANVASSSSSGVSGVPTAAMMNVAAVGTKGTRSKK